MLATAQRMRTSTRCAQVFEVDAALWPARHAAPGRHPFSPSLRAVCGPTAGAAYVTRHRAGGAVDEHLAGASGLPGAGEHCLPRPLANERDARAGGLLRPAAQICQHYLRWCAARRGPPQASATGRLDQFRPRLQCCGGLVAVPGRCTPGGGQRLRTTAVVRWQCPALHDGHHRPPVELDEVDCASSCADSGTRWRRPVRWWMICCTPWARGGCLNLGYRALAVLTTPMGIPAGERCALRPQGCRVLALGRAPTGDQRGATQRIGTVGMGSRAKIERRSVGQGLPVAMEAAAGKTADFFAVVIAPCVISAAI